MKTGNMSGDLFWFITLLSTFLTVKEKHEAVASVKSGEDKIEALEAELEYLRVQIKVGGGVMPSDDSSYTEHKSGNNAHLLRLLFHACHLFIWLFT